ncbi:MAG TPA: IclR family transcriptional regulator [Ktedonobacterales bacterium]|nr:IclR family transcriptional regulator [Ktedonobacterales bacterium]
MAETLSTRDIPSSRGRNATADRAIDVLLLFSEQQPMLSAEEIAERLGMSRSTTYRYLQGLRAYGLIEESEINGRFRLGSVVVRLARVARKGLGLPELALPAMRMLTATTGETSLLTRRVGEQVICIERVESALPVRLSYERGHVLPLHAGASAKALLAFLPEQEIEALIGAIPKTRYTENTVTDPDQLRQQLARIRNQGYSITNGEVDSGVRGIAAPIFGSDNQVVGAVSIAGPSFRLNDEALPHAIQAVREAATEITHRWQEFAL